MTKRNSILLFLLGLFSELHVRVVGSLGISELLIFVIAPIVFVTDYAKLKRDGFLTYLRCVYLAVFGCAVSSISNGTQFQFFIRGFASVYSLFAIPVVLHRYLANNLPGLKWLLLGVAISGVLTTFGFQSAVEVASGEIVEGGISDTELYFVRHFGGVLTVWYRGWYFSCPTIVAIILMLIPIFQMILYTGTGRSALLVSLSSLFLLLYVNRHISRMRIMKKKFTFVCISAILIIFGCTSLYKFAAAKGFLNEGAHKKYEQQTKKGGGPFALLLSGRSDAFAGLIACFDKPILGHGPWAMDDGQYWHNFIIKYGDEEDYKKFLSEQNFRAKMGMTASLIPAHSHIITFWLWFGILGLPIWLYVIKKIVEYFRHYIDAVPQWYAVIACGAPGIIWNIFFSPFSSRVPVSIFITALLLAISVGKGRLNLPMEMIEEAMKHGK